MSDISSLNDATNRSPIQRLQAFSELTRAQAEQDPTVQRALLSMLDEPLLESSHRMMLGELLGRFGDSRLRRPSDDDYWSLASIDEDYNLYVGQFMVTTAEWIRFLMTGAYDEAANWSEEGLAWKLADRPTWRQLADGQSEDLIIANQPVVGVCWYEAQAYAKAMNARLLSVDERVHITRGVKMRPYPWGAPFGQSNANTGEEGLGKPSAVGVFPRDKTPEGIFDLAGNVAEWTSDTVGRRCVIHPGSWKQPSMAAWAKAIQLISPAARTVDLGFRIARDV